MKIVIGQGSCGIASGAKKTEAEFRRQIDEKKLDAVVTIAGCIGSCYLEPIVDVYEEDGTLSRYVNLTADKVAAVVDRHIAGKKPVTEYLIPEEGSAFLSKTDQNRAEKLRGDQSRGYQ
jgi:NADH-quinone oxidoreductase subunit F